MLNHNFITLAKAEIKDLYFGKWRKICSSFKWIKPLFLSNRVHRHTHTHRHTDSKTDTKTNKWT